MSHTLIDDTIWARLAPLIPGAAFEKGTGMAGGRFPTAPF
jgi:hypothetical protein